MHGVQACLSSPSGAQCKTLTERWADALARHLKCSYRSHDFNHLCAREQGMAAGGTAGCWQASVKGQGREVHNMLVATTGQAGRACRLLCPMLPPVVIAARAGSGGRACRAAAPAGRQRCAGARRTRACVRACVLARPQVLPARCAVRGAHAQLYRCAFVQLRIWQQTGLTKMGRTSDSPTKLHLS